MKLSDQLKQLRSDVENISSGNIAHKKANIIGNLNWIIKKLDEKEGEVEREAEIYAESFRYKVDDGSWFENKKTDFIAGFQKNNNVF